MTLTNEQLKILLLGANLINPDTFSVAEREAQEKKIPLEEYLPEAGLISDEHLGQIIANYFKFDYIDLKKEKIDEDILRLVSEVVARSRGVVAISRTEAGVRVGFRNPRDLEMRHVIEKRLGEKVLPFYITTQGLESALVQYKADIKTAFEAALKQLHSKELGREERDELMVKLVDTLLEYGYENKASDIHIEPHREKISIRFRIDGIMHTVLEISGEFAETI